MKKLTPKWNRKQKNIIILKTYWVQKYQFSKLNSLEYIYFWFIFLSLHKIIIKWLKKIKLHTLAFYLSIVISNICSSLNIILVQPNIFSIIILQKKWLYLTICNKCWIIQLVINLGSSLKIFKIMDYSN